MPASAASASAAAHAAKQPQSTIEAYPDVARMAVEGATNREIAQALFLSVKTIEMHLSHAYRKLDIGSRQELPATMPTEAY